MPPKINCFENTLGWLGLIGHIVTPVVWCPGGSIEGHMGPLIVLLHHRSPCGSCNGSHHWSLLLVPVVYICPCSSKGSCVLMKGTMGVWSKVMSEVLLAIPTRVISWFLLFLLSCVPWFFPSWFHQGFCTWVLPWHLMLNTSHPVMNGGTHSPPS